MDVLIDIPIELEPAYKAPYEEEVINDVKFNIDYYRSHMVPVREIVELKKATTHE